MYQNDPERFMYDVFGDYLWSAQIKILDLIKSGAKRIAVKAAHSVSKSFTFGRLAIWNTVCFYPVLTFTTAPTHRQVNEILWKEIRSGWKKSKYQLSPEPPLPGSAYWKIRPNMRAMGASSDKPELLQGLHEGEGRVLALTDEVCGIAKAMFPAINSLVTGENDVACYVGNPDWRNPEFMRMFSDPSFQTLTISAYDSPNFTGENVPDKLKKALVSKSWVEDLIRAYGEDSPIVASKVRAEFPNEDADTLIPLSYIEAAEERPIVDDGQRLAGMDVARYGSDLTIIYTIDGNNAVIRHISGKQPLTDSSGHAVLTIRAGYRLASDDTGVGGGVTDIVKEFGLHIEPVNFGMAAKDPTRFFNSRAEMYWTLRDWIRDTGHINKDMDLRNDLVDIRYRVRPDGRIQIESKDEIRKRKGHSPDRADALALAVAGHGYGGVCASIDSDSQYSYAQTESDREMF